MYIFFWANTLDYFLRENTLDIYLDFRMYGKVAQGTYKL